MLLACVLSAALFFAAATSVAAREVEPPVVPQIGYTPLAPLPETGPCSNTDTARIKSGQQTHCLPTEVNTLGGYLRGVYILGVALAGLFAVFSIVRGGFQLLWTDSILGHSEGKAMILRALGGLLIVYASYILMNTINPQLARDLNLELALPEITVQRGVADQLFSWAPDLPDFDEANRQNILASSKEARETIAEKEEGARDLRRQAAAMGPFSALDDAGKTAYRGLIQDAEKLEAESLKTFADAAARNSVLNQINVNDKKYDPVFEKKNLDRMQATLSGAATKLASGDELGLATQVLREQVQQGNSMRIGITQYEMHNTAPDSVLQTVTRSKATLTKFNSDRAIEQMSAMVTDTEKAIQRMQAMSDRAAADQMVRVETAPGVYERKNAKAYIGEQITNMRTETINNIKVAQSNCAPTLIGGGRTFPCTTWQPPLAYR
jgi:hypothetical protein